MSKIKIFSLGGLNENGKNMYVVEVDSDIFIFDAGTKYADDKMFGIDYIIPNFDYIKTNKERVKGIFITHGHNENMGAIYDIISDIPNINIYGTNFTLLKIKRELIDEGMEFNNLHLIQPHKLVKFGKNGIFPISMTHSIPDSVGYALNTEDGIIFYTGDYVFDSTMRGVYKTDIGKLAYIGKQGVLCLLGESVYSEKKGHTAPNNRINNLIRETLYKFEDRIIYTFFNAHLYRVQELFDEISKTNRKIVIMSKKLQTLINEAIDNHYLVINKNKIGDLSNINDKNVVVLISNERDRPFANIERIIAGYDKFIQLKQTDTVFFATPTYDTNEKKVVTLGDEIAKRGANIVSLSNKRHLSFHASKEDIMLLLDLISPKYYFPVKGEYRYQVEAAKVAEAIGMNKEHILLKQNGDIVEFQNGKLIESFEKVPTDSIFIDGNNGDDIGELVLKDRELLSDNGIVIISTTLRRKTKEIVMGPQMITRGFIYAKENSELIKSAEEICKKVIIQNTENNYIEYNKVKNGIRENLAKFLFRETACKPMIITVIQEI